MKKLLLISVAALAFNCSAQSTTNSAPSLASGLSIIAQSVASATNWTVLSGYGRSSSGHNNLAFGALAYNFTQNVGVVAGYDNLWASGSGSQASIIKGGVTLSAPVHPFAFIGSTFATNIVGTPFVADLLATPKGGNAVGNIVTSGINFDIWRIKNFELTIGAQYEKRMGQANWDGNYIIGHLGISRRF